MKKTLFAFSVTVILSIVVFLGIGLSGCNWFNTTILGKPSQTELAEREKQRQGELNRLDSIRRAEAEKLAGLQAKDASSSSSSNTGNSHKSYHVILGCYEEQVNVDNMMATLKNNGYHPYTLTIGGLTAVSAAGFDSESQALAEIQKMEEKDFHQEDAWVYKKP